MHRFVISLAVALCASTAYADEPAPPEEQAFSPIQTAAVCFFQGEQRSGMNKICYYNCMGSTVAINVSSIAFCPLSINR